MAKTHRSNACECASSSGGRIVAVLRGCLSFWTAERAQRSILHFRNRRIGDKRLLQERLLMDWWKRAHVEHSRTVLVHSFREAFLESTRLTLVSMGLVDHASTRTRLAPEPGAFFHLKIITIDFGWNSAKHARCTYIQKVVNPLPVDESPPDAPLEESRAPVAREDSWHKMS